MLVLLPPSETKRAGGGGPKLDLRSLAHPSLNPTRRAVVAALVALSADPEGAARVLKLGPTQRHEVAVNRALRRSATMPAVDRYTGVLFDALDAGSLDADARAWLGGHVHIHSAPFGPVSALDPIPAYRLPAGVALPGVAALRRVWADAVSRAIGTSGADFVLDLRSEAYVALGPVPESTSSAYVRVVTEGRDGVVRALNHFNKHAKGALVRMLATQRPAIDSGDSLRAWAMGAGLRLEAGERAGELHLVEPAEMILSRTPADR